MTMDAGSPMSRCSGMPTKPCIQKVLFPHLRVDELVLSLDIDIDDDSVRKYLNQLKILIYKMFYDILTSMCFLIITWL